jgi:hypothetical protein
MVLRPESSILFVAKFTSAKRGMQSMDIGIIAAIALLVIWAIGTLLNGPGWIHLLLTIGVSMLIWRIVVRGDRAHPTPKK